jgi:hypothetical protein
MDWQTPDSLLDLVREVGPIALDPCTVHANPVQARRYITQDEPAEIFRAPPGFLGATGAGKFAFGPFGWVGDNGLTADWQLWARGHGLVYMNPPYGRELAAWMSKAEDESLYGTEIIALVPARPDTRWFQGACQQKGGQTPTILFWKGRLKFKGAPACAPFPSALFYWGPRHERFCEVFAGKGLFL